MTYDPDFLDSFAPHDAEICTDEAWPLPAVQSLEGTFDKPQRSLREVAWRWLFGRSDE